jgi:uncharacterized membrane protein YfcA
MSEQPKLSDVLNSVVHLQDPTPELKSALQSLTPTLQQELDVKAAVALQSVLAPPTGETNNRIWLIIIGAFALVMVGTAAVLGIGLFLVAPKDTQYITKADMVLTLFTTTVGFLAGFLGVGGGFLSVPSLVLFLHMPMKLATGTSLFIIAANSTVPLFGHRHSLQVSWTLVLELVPPALLATTLGVKLSERFTGPQLRKVFGAFVILLGVFMIASNAATLFRR